MGCAMFKRSPRFTELSPPLRLATVVLGAVQVALYVAAYVSIARRPAAEIRGSKTKWRLVCLLNTIGPLSYFRWGRVRAEQS
jgi:hypothetical protein